MELSEQEIKRAAEIKQWAESRIAELDEEMTRLKEILSILDVFLRKTSFQSASTIPKGVQSGAAASSQKSAQISVTTEYKEVKPLTRAKDGQLLANAYVSDSSVAVVPASDIVLESTKPPFKSFFLNRILEGMRSKDLENVSAGRLSEDEVLSYDVEDQDGVIRKIVVNNYRDKGRLNEIFNTSAWTFARMLEKK
jgi:hypothetical protein